MKKTIFTTIMILLLSLVASAADEIMIGTPVVDGVLDLSYLNSYKIEVSGEKNTFYTAKGGTADGAKGDTATAYYLYDDSYLYVCIDVKDDALYSRGKAWIIKNIADLSWENDAVEARVYYPELGDPVQANQYIFQCDAKGIAATNYKGMCEEAFTASTTVNAEGYTVEFAIPLSFDKKAGDEIGLSVEIDDLHELISGSTTTLGGHNFNAYGSQHPYDNMVKLGTQKVSQKFTVFDDTKNHWGRNDISYVLQAGLFNGTGKGFEPDSQMTRAMFATVLGRLYEKKNGSLTEYNSPAKFNDVDYRLWYGKYVDWASGAGIINGYGDSTFKPNDPITREEMAVMLFRYTKAIYSDKKLGFADASSVSDWAATAVSYCFENGYIAGDAENKLMPKKNATRAEVATFMARYMRSATVRVY